MLTPDDVRNVVFSGAWRKERGYDEAEVDRFLARVEATLRGKRLVTARDVLTAEFSPRKKGARAYKKSQVDRFLDKVALTLMKLEVRDEDGAPRRHRLASDGHEQPSRGESAAPRRRQADPPADGTEQFGPEPPAPELPAAEEGAARPRRPERPEADTRRQLPQRRSAQPRQSSDSGPMPAQPPTAAPPAQPPAVAPAQPPAPAAPATSSGPAQAPPVAQPPAAGAASASELVRDPARFGALEPAKSPSTALDKGEVDAFMDRVQATLRGADAISSKDVLGARFNPPAPGMPGYDKEGVIAFLKVISVSIQNLTSRNMRPVDPAAGAARQNGSGQGSGRPPPPAADQRPASTNMRPAAGAAAQQAPGTGQAGSGAFPAQISGNLRTGQQNPAGRRG
ncbi:hypothetical protein GCM10009854_31240 [Saccharopolyspora halophila]|uniref:Cell wall synthesis protein Wag31 n=1 Tax=Saccharopolyspora halophila TaxID=405551 RepID=A0ABP5TH89_9PSEU